MKIRLKLTLLFCALFGILLLGFSLLIYYSSANGREEEYFKRLRQLAITKTNLLLDAKVQPSVLQLIYKNSLNSLPQEEVAIFDTAFHLLYHDAGDIDRVTETKGMIDSIIALKEIHFYVGDLQAIGFVYPYEGRVYAITAAARDDDGFRKLKALRFDLAAGFLTAILLTLLAGILFSRNALRPVSAMVGRVGEISASRLDLRIGEGNGKDEIAELAITFNHMLTRLQHSFEAQKQFVSNISHELRTPLAAIIAELEISTIRERTTDEYRTMVLLILEDARKLARLSNGLLDLAKASYDQTEISFRELRLDEALMDARQAILHSHPGYKVDIIFEGEIGEGDFISIKGNEYLLKVAFANLMENGCKFSADQQCSVSIDSGPQRTLLRFADRGIGIAEEAIPKIFTPFYRGANQQYADGHGIGLSLTQKIIALHRGRISVLSTIGEGSTFTVEFPAE